MIIYKCCRIDLRLPALLGMLVVGILLKNIPYNVYEMAQPGCADYNQTVITEETQQFRARKVKEDDLE